jgi:IS5 family transposase
VRNGEGLAILVHFGLNQNRLSGESSMLRDRYDPMDLFALVPTLSLAMEPVFAQLDRLLDDDVLFQRLKADLRRRAPFTTTRGRPSTPVEVILRMLVVKRLYHWSYEETEHFVADSLVLRQFCRIYLQSVPDDTTLLRWADLIDPGTLTALNERVGELARSLKVTRGRKLRVDSMVVETNIHHPTDSGLISDGVRVLSRMLRRAKAVAGQATGLGQAAFRSRMRSVRRLVRQLQRLARRKRDEATARLRLAYGRLITVARKTQAQAAKVCVALQGQTGASAQRLVRQFAQFLPRVERVITQSVRRVLQGEVVPAQDKLVSLFEPHTQIIVRRKTGKPVEFGCKVWLEEVEGGILSGYRILAEAGQDFPYLPDSLVAHEQRFGRPPQLLAADRGVYSAANEAKARQARVRRIVMPYAGKAPPTRVAQERTTWFRRGLRFRAGIEGRISVLNRRFGLDSCPDHGEAGLGRWVGWGIVTANLITIARTVARRSTRSLRRAA